MQPLKYRKGVSLVIMPSPESPPAPDRPLPGGRLSVDLVNTTWRSDEMLVDWLEFDSSVDEFTTSHGHPASQNDLVDIRRSLSEHRDLLRTIFEAGSLDALLPETAQEVEHRLRAARLTLDPMPDRAVRITGDRTSNALAVEALVDGLDLIRERPERLRRCEHEQCVLWFLDTSKGGRRRWCSMQTCGNRAKAKRHYERATTERD